MTKTIDTQYNFWLAGYYDDFASARAIADDQNVANHRTIDHTISHFGSAIGRVARLNTRFKFSSADRLRTGGYHDDDPKADKTDYFFSTTQDTLAFNANISEWLSRNIVEDNSELYNSRAILQHPISVVANRQKFNGSAGDSYLMFRNGHNTAGVYYSAIGEMDFSYGRSPLSRKDEPDFTTATNAHKAAGNPIAYYQKGNFRASGDATHETPDKTMAMVSFASVYAGELPSLVLSATRPNAYIYDLVSPSKMPFFIHNLFVERGDGVDAGSATVTNGTNRILAYDGNLRLKGIGESFHLRMAMHTISEFTPTSYTVKIGYKEGATYNRTSNEFSDTQALITLTFDPTAIGMSGSMTKHAAGEPILRPVVDEWVDIEVVPDFVLNTWKAYANGSTSQFANGVINIAGHSMATAKGWSLDLNWNHAVDDYVCVSTMLDRVGVALPLTNRFDNNYDKVSPINSFSIQYGANNISSAEVKILDDSKNYTLAPLTTGTSPSDWRLLMFEGGEDRPLWWGHIESVNYQQNLYNNTLEATIRARDSFSTLGRTLPIWELGQGAFFSLSNHISMDSTYQKRSSETTAISNLLLFGVGQITYKQASLGFTRHDNEEVARYSDILNGRQSLFSSSLIQMYINEDERGPNNVENQWLGYNASTNKEINDILAIRNLAGYRDIYMAWDGESTKSTSAYRGLAVSDFVKLIGSDYDGAYEIYSIRYEYKGESNSDDIVVIRIIDAGATAAQDRTAVFSSGSSSALGSVSSTHRYYNIGTTAAHGLEIGDTIRMICDNSSASSSNAFHLQDFVVQAAPTATTFHIIAEIGLLKTGTIFPYSIWNGAENTPPENPAIIRHNYTGTAPDQSTYDQVQYRVAHARWLRDLPMSTWFKANFGIIHPKPYWRGGKGSKAQHPFNAGQAALITGWPNADGSASWTGLASDIDVGDTVITVEEPALWYALKSRGIKEYILDLIDIETNETQFVIGNAVSEPTFTANPVWNDTNKDFTLNNSFAISQIVVHVGFDYDDLNGIHMITERTSTTYKTKKVVDFLPTRDGFAYLQARQLTDGGWSDGSSHANLDPDRISITYKDCSQFDTSSQNDTGHRTYYGNSRLQGIKGIKRQWKPEHTIYNLRQVDESNGYKHCFVGWADMRNNGDANADGGYRKNEFGLLLPTNENYSLNLVFADQFDQVGNPDVFAELKIGEDADIWAFDSEVEPYSGAAWCTLTGASNEEPFATHFHNWDEKAGAFTIVDVSRFWNLNTAACGGRSGYDSGGVVDFGDFETATFGFPYLIDNYWKEASCSYKNSHDESIFPHHPNSLYFINDGTSLSSDISIGDSRIYVEDVSEFDSTGYGVILAEGGSNRDSEKIAYYFYWNGKGSVTLSGVQTDYLDNVFITTYEVVTDPKNAVDQLTADVAASLTDSEVEIGTKEFKAEADQQEGDFDKVRVYNTTAALYGMRLILNLEGTVESPAQGTYFPNDKIRVIQNLNLADTWATNASLPCISDINNVPMQNNNAGGESYGSSLDARGQTIQTIISSMQEKDGVSLANEIKSLSWLMGRDNRMEFRDTINSRHALSRTNLQVSQLSTQTGSRITNVRVYYNGNSAFVDYPETVGTDPRFRVLNHEDLFNREEAFNIAKQNYLRESTPRVSINAEVSQDSNRMIGNGRFGYVADVFRKAYYNDSQSLSWWTNRLGGHPFCGMQNALDAEGNANPSTGGYYYAQLVDEEDPSTYGFTPHLVVRDGGATTNPDTQTGELVIDHSSSEITFNLGGNAGTALAVSASGWYAPICTISGTDYMLSVYYDGTTLASTTYDLQFSYAFPITSASSVPYHFYGANSLTHAIQVAYVGSGTNLVSDTSTNELRLMIETKTGASSYADTEFILHLCDYTFDEALGSAPTFGCPTLDVLSLEGSTTVDLTTNGFVEVQVPSSYQSTQPYITFSVNIDYLRELVRLRGGDTGMNLPSSHGITLSKGTSSGAGIFPLGMRTFDDMGHIAENRAAYYAPRLHVVRDVDFVPATQITYTDDHIDMTNESLIIKTVRWSQKDRGVEKVTLGLEKSEKHYAYSLTSALARPPREREPAKPRPPPPTPRPPISDGLGGGLGTAPAPMRTQGADSPMSGVPSMDAIGGSNFGFNQLSSNLLRGIRGKSNFRSDTGSSGSQWGVLGSANTGVSSSFDRAIDGLEGSTTTSEGSAIATSDGFSLAGINDPEVGAQGERHSHQLNARVPNDTSTGFISVIGSITLESIAGGGNAEITTTIECLETASSISSTKIITQGSTRQNIVLVPSTYLNGAETPNNTLKITVERKPAQGNDAAGYQTVTIHNLEVTLRRYNIPNAGQSQAFSPY